MHSYNALSAGDVYGTEYGIADFYTNATAQMAFDARLVHVLNHVHTTLGKPWKELNEYVFGFEAENEAMIGDVRVSPHDDFYADVVDIVLVGANIHSRTSAMVSGHA